MKILDIVPGTSVDGPGLRTAIYFAGCRHECPGCHNPQSWDFGGGNEMTVGEVMAVIDENDFDVTFTGGDPVYSAEEILPLAEAIHKSGRTLWIYTGFLYEDLCRMGGAQGEAVRKLMELADVLVDGPFVEPLRDIHQPFRGSSNQRLIDLHRSTSDKPVIWDW